MPIDTRRVQGPDNSKPYLLFAKKKDKSYKDILSDLVSNGKRRDGRRLDQQRRILSGCIANRVIDPPDLKTGVVTQAKGSAYMELNKTKVICSVYDPREIPGKTDYSMNGELYCEFKFAPFSCITRRGHQHDTEEKEFSLNLKRALEPAVCRHEFPNFQVVCLLVHSASSPTSRLFVYLCTARVPQLPGCLFTCAQREFPNFQVVYLLVHIASSPTYRLVVYLCIARVPQLTGCLFTCVQHEFPNFQVDVYAQVIENDGSALAAAITCAGLALADACVPMYDLVTAATLGIHGDLQFKDPTHEEEMLCSSAPPEGSPSRSYGIITAAYSPTHNQVSEFSHQGSIDMDTLAAIIPTFTETCHLIYPVIKQVLISNVTKTIKKRKKEALFQISGDE
ncbi:unnamed protein product [Timema podura]|uniref:Exoribonuclease phosphorolytic domain-containing protein n=1 Tax=Timema podura TaxID=61482 RepID=A0ABN7NUZ8_TIMPD|nr:unnamed protein product [Timema podura]